MSKTGLSESKAAGALIASNPQQRLITPEEVAFVALTLCHDLARGINGQAIVVDGGGLLS